MSFAKFRHLLFFGFLAIITLVFFYIISNFAFPILWAGVLASLFFPIYSWFLKKIKHPGLSAGITLGIITLSIALPFTIVGTLLVQETRHIYTALSTNSGELTATLQSTLEQAASNPVLAHLSIDPKSVVNKFSELATLVVSFILNGLTDFAGKSFSFLFMLFITLYTLYFFLRDGKKLLLMLMHLCPLGDKYEKILYHKFTTTANATLKGTLIVGAVQGTLGGLLFWMAGIDGAIIWGVVMTMLSVIPAFSSAIVWLPAGLVLLASGHITRGIVVIAVGLLVISTIDNFLRPILIGRDTQMHPLLVLFSTLGGIFAFGLSGFVIGPVIASLFLSFWEMYENYYREDLEHNEE